MRQRLTKYWWVWLLVAALAITANELFDHYGSAGNTSSHPAADILIAIVIVAIAASGWEFLARRKSGRD